MQYKCEHCGYSEVYLNTKEHSYTCPACNCTFPLVGVDTAAQDLTDKLDLTREQDIATALKNLQNEADKINPNTATLKAYALEVKRYLKKHFLADVILYLCDKNYHDLSKYLSKTNISKVPQPTLISALINMIKSLHTTIEYKVASLIEKYVESLPMQTELWNMYEIESEKLKQGKYDIFPRDVFIAHSGKDSNKINALYNYLTIKLGLSVWISTINLRHGVNADAEYLSTIERAIDSCSVFLFVGSSNSRHNSCDAYSKELLMYLDALDKKNLPAEQRNRPISEWNRRLMKPRVQYMLEEYDPDSPFDNVVKQYFDGYTNCQTIKALGNSLAQLLRPNTDIFDDTKSEESSAAKKPADEINDELPKTLEGDTTVADKPKDPTLNVEYTIRNGVLTDCHGNGNPIKSLPYSVKNIGICAFANYPDITEVTLPQGVTTIDAYAFWKCKKLIKVTFPKSVTHIDNSAFEGCENLVEIKFATSPQSVSIGYAAFRNCKSLKSLTLPVGIKFIGEKAFEGCDSLVSLTFQNTHNWTKINLQNNATTSDKYQLQSPAKNARRFRGDGYMHKYNLCAWLKH